MAGEAYDAHEQPMQPAPHNVYVRDIDARMREDVPIGDGVMDLKAIVDAAKAMGFNGFCSLEQDGPPTK